MMRIERMTSPLPRECSTTEPHGQGSGAGEGNRTLVGGLEGPSSTIELHPLKFEDYIIPPRGTFLLNCCSSIAGGGGWIRTIVGVSQQIYSLPPLATRAPLRSEWQIMRVEKNFVKFFRLIDAKFLPLWRRTVYLRAAPAQFLHFLAVGLPAASAKKGHFTQTSSGFKPFPKTFAK